MIYHNLAEMNYCRFQAGRVGGNIADSDFAFGWCLSGSMWKLEHVGNRC